MVGRKGSYGKINWSDEAVFASDTTFFIDSKVTSHHLRWLYWVLQTLKLDEGSSEAAVPGLNRETVYETVAMVPDHDLQTQIADYLDRETAEIDILVQEKQGMLALLEQKRAALIRHFVTRGLNPRTRLKDSGLGWLPQVPAHWEIRKMKFVGAIGNGSTPNVENLDYWTDNPSSYPWLNSSVVNDDYVSSASRYVTELALKECHLPKIKPPAVLVGITGQGKTRGKASVLNFEATINQHVAFIAPFSSSCEYLQALLQTAYGFLRSESDGAGSTKGAITCEQLANFAIPVPPVEEQLVIVEAIKVEREKSTTIETALEESLHLIEKRRAALITAAVTGQIPLNRMKP